MSAVAKIESQMDFTPSILGSGVDGREGGGGLKINNNNRCDAGSVEKWDETISKLYRLS